MSTYHLTASDMEKLDAEGIRLGDDPERYIPPIIETEPEDESHD